MSFGNIDPVANERSRLAGEHYWALESSLNDRRTRAAVVAEKFNVSKGKSRREQVQLMKELFPNLPDLPAEVKDDAVKDGEALESFPWIEPPVRCDYGTEVKLGKDIFIGSNLIMLDCNVISVGDRCLIGPNVSLFAAGHPLDPAVRNGVKGPEFAKPITIEADCWIGGNVIVCQGVTIGRGSTIGAGSIVTKVSASLSCSK
ncbi:trimeric LpxA-like protein [Meredithblackwellia eburnea MCA 4105]